MRDALAEWRPIVDEEIAEILHNGTGIVDDVEDGATMRRCEPALLHQYGVDIALNAGNAIYFLPLKVIARNPAASTAMHSSTPPPRDRPRSDIFSRGPLEAPAMSDGSAGVSRRGFLRTGTGAIAATAATGVAGAQEDGEDGGGGGSAGPPDYGTWFSDVGNYDGSTQDMRGQETVTVEVGVEGNGGPNAFGPPAIHVDTGTTVQFEWTGDGFHNVVEENEEWSSGSAVGEAGVNYERTFEQAGIQKYFCDPHLGVGMKGAVVVGDDYPTVDTGSGAGPALPDAAKSIGVAASMVMAATLGLAYVFVRHGGSRREE